MSRAEIHDKITELLELIDINHNRLVLNESSFDLDLAQLRNLIVQLYTQLDQLEHSKEDVAPVVEDEQPPVVEQEAPPPPLVKPKVFTPITEDIVDENDEDPILTSKAPIQKEEPIIEAIPEPIPTPEPALEITPEIKPEPEVQPKADVPIDPPKAKEEINETDRPERSSKSRGDGDVFSQLRRHRLESIKKGIGIGKRYEIQNELFDNDPAAYNSAIDALDQAGSFEAAETELLDHLATERRWDPEHPLLEELRLLLERRYL